VEAAKQQTNAKETIAVLTAFDLKKKNTFFEC
jgi:hypothetical protein